MKVGTCVFTKAGRLAGLADCYAAIVLVDNATFLLAVNRIASFWWHSAIIANMIISSRGSVGRASAPWLCPLRHTRSVRNYPTSASAERATPKPHSLSFLHNKYTFALCAAQHCYGLPVYLWKIPDCCNYEKIVGGFVWTPNDSVVKYIQSVESLWISMR